MPDINQPILHITSRDNPALKQLRLLVRDGASYRKHGQIWLEGDHLCRALLARGLQPCMALFASEAAWQAAQWAHPINCKVLIVEQKLMNEFSSLESPAPMGFVLNLPAPAAVQTAKPTVILDRLQDPGNVGSVLRSAAAFGFGQIVAMKGTAALWGSKVLRAGMGAHFALDLIEGASLADLASLHMPLLVTSSHQGQWLHQAQLPWPCAWVMGHEGQGVCTELEALATQHIRIAQPGGEESLNVAAAAAICLHASVRHQQTI